MKPREKNFPSNNPPKKVLEKDKTNIRHNSKHGESSPDFHPNETKKNVVEVPLEIPQKRLGKQKKEGYFYENLTQPVSKSLLKEIEYGEKNDEYYIRAKNGKEIKVIPAGRAKKLRESNNKRKQEQSLDNNKKRKIENNENPISLSKNFSPTPTLNPNDYYPRNGNIPPFPTSLPWNPTIFGEKASLENSNNNQFGKDTILEKELLSLVKSFK